MFFQSGVDDFLEINQTGFPLHGSWQSFLFLHDGFLS
jgi:hypothetical protein